MAEILTQTGDFPPISGAIDYYTRNGGANRRRLMPPHRSDQRITLTPNLYALIERVNAEINDPNSRSPLRIQYARDQDVHGRDEFWANPHRLTGIYIDPATGRRIPKRNHGDCEDIAIATRDEIIRRAKRELGIDINPGALLLAFVDTTRAGSLDHAVLMLRGKSPQGENMDLILGDQKKEIIHWYQSSYSFIAMETPEDPAKYREVTGRFDQTFRLPNVFIRSTLSQRDSSWNSSLVNGSEIDAGNTVYAYGYFDPTVLKQSPLAQTSGNTVMAFTQPFRALATSGKDAVSYAYTIYRDNIPLREINSFDPNDALLSVRRMISPTPGANEKIGTYQLQYHVEGGPPVSFTVTAMEVGGRTRVIESTDAAERATQREHMAKFREAMKKAGIVWMDPKGRDIDPQQIPTPEDLRAAGRAIIQASEAKEKETEVVPPVGVPIDHDRARAQPTPPR